MAKSHPTSSKSAKTSASKVSRKDTKAGKAGKSGAIDSSRDDHDRELANGVRQIYL